jgi:hypothetical protein
MRTIFDQSTRDELIKRINTLTETKQAQCDKMYAYQMLRLLCFWVISLGFNKSFFKQNVSEK